MATRLRVERRAGFNTVDVMITGVRSAATTFYPEKVLDPLRPALILPEVLDSSAGNHR